jgi:hypothetical protein
MKRTEFKPMSDDVELKQRLSKLSNDELIEMVTVGAPDYRQDALDYAKAELKYRRVDWSDVGHEEEEETEVDSSNQPAESASAISPACLACGGTLRAATLVAEKELTVIFSDNREERFVRVMACAQCGQITLIADYENDVAQ